ncbi:TetR/AcrR family transcriptional regulator [Paraconexibacter sp.]|uniref:TetR/AcrR family transcriptional regulator n=1 Tax=Paraconexibacter sp. TaxID=2949640 RepID=UPI003563B89E
MGAEVKTRRARGERRREELLRAALRVIGQRGVGQTTHRAIADEAGVPPATTSYYFASIDALLEEALRLFVEEEVSRLHDLADRLDSGVVGGAEVAALFTAELLGTGERVPVRRTTTTAQFELYLEATRRPALEAVARECVDGYVQVAVAALRAVGTPEPERAGAAVVALIDGFALHGLASPDHAVGADELRTALAALWAGWLATTGT